MPSPVTTEQVIAAKRDVPLQPVLRNMADALERLAVQLREGYMPHETSPGRILPFKRDVFERVARTLDEML